jgi:hypothetical protein
MPAYSAPITDMLYVLGELLDVESVLSLCCMDRQPPVG